MFNGLHIAMLRTILALHAAHHRAPRPVADALFRGPLDEIRLETQLRASTARGVLPDWDAADRALAWLSVPGHQVVLQTEAAFPARLRAVPSAPPLLFVDGDPAVLSATQLAMVGSRQATPRGRDLAYAFARQLASCGVVITSGLARGIDGAAHRGALAGDGRTVAVLGCAIDRIYPAAHRGLAEDIRHAGALVSEFPFGTPPLPGHFPRRNRIISGLAIGTLVVEAALRSGSLSTAFHALEQGREVFAVPGSILSPLSRGGHALIKQGAKLVESVADIVEELPELQRLGRFENAATQGSDQARACTEQETRLLGVCGWDPFTTDELVLRSGLTVQAVSSMLVRLELAGIVQVQGTGSYLRIR